MGCTGQALYLCSKPTQELTLAIFSSLVFCFCVISASMLNIPELPLCMKGEGRWHVQAYHLPVRRADV